MLILEGTPYIYIIYLVLNTALDERQTFLHQRIMHNFDFFFLFSEGRFLKACCEDFNLSLSIRLSPLLLGTMFVKELLDEF